MRALEVLAFGPMTAPHLAAVLGVHPRTARRLLGELQRDGWLSCSPKAPRVYAPTLRLVTLAAQIGSRAPLALLTAPALERLHAVTGLVATLAIPSYDATICLVRCSGDGLLQPPLGQLVSASRCASGKVLLAHREPWRHSILDTLPPGEDRAHLERELGRIRADGYAIETGTGTDRALELAAPVRGPEHDVPAAIGVTTQACEASRDLIDAVREAAQAATMALVQLPQSSLHRGIAVRLLGSYGRAPVDAHV
jgi:DNA-binding IclR family transcriptional regulator